MEYQKSSSRPSSNERPGCNASEKFEKFEGREHQSCLNFKRIVAESVLHVAARSFLRDRSREESPVDSFKRASGILETVFKGAMHFEGGAQQEGLLCAERRRPASEREAVANKGSCQRPERRVKRGMASRAGFAVAVLVATSIGLAEGFSGNLGLSLGRSQGIGLASKQGMASGLPQKAAVGCSLWAGGFGAKKAARAARGNIVQLSSSTASFLDLVGHPLRILPTVRSICRPLSCAFSCPQHFVAPH
jgi:hypothetical protein